MSANQQPVSMQLQGRRREPWGRHAKRHGVSTKTLDRWVKAGIVDPPEYINGRKYGDPDSSPRRDKAE
jgi:hypothetical protein